MTIFEQYALLKAKMTELENQEAELRTQILEQMVENGEEKVETAIGSFKKATLKKWVYPEEVLEKEEEYKAEKAKAESIGTATYTEKASLRFTPIHL